MRRLTLGDCREEVAKVADLCANDDRVVSLVNIAERRLIRRGKWLGSVQRYRIAVTDALVTWPRQVTTVEAVSFCDHPGTVRNGWWEFLGHGVGQLKSDSTWWDNLVDRGQACTFNDVTPGQINRKARVYADVSEAANLYLTIQGYDENGNWIRTLDGSDWIDGEKVLISTTPTLSTKLFTSITGVLKPITNGPVRVFEYNTDTLANVQQLAYYEPDETRPVYRRSLLPGIMDTETCDDTDNRCVTVALKLRHIPVRNDNDWLILGNLDALKLAAQAIAKERRDLFAEAQAYWGQAISELEKELREYQGDGEVVSPRIAPDFGGGAIAHII